MDDEQFAELMSDILEHAVEVGEPDRMHGGEPYEILLAGIAAELRVIRLILEAQTKDEGNDSWKWGGEDYQ